MTRIQITVALSLLTTACEPRDDGDVWRFAIEESPGSVQDAYAQRFRELIEERMGSEVRVEVYPYGTLGTSDQITEQLHNGTLQFAMASPGHLGKLIPEVQVFLLHFVFADDEAVNQRLLRDDAGLRERLNALFEEKGFQFLSAFSEGWMAWTTHEEIRVPDDFEGVRFRVMTTPLLLELYRAYGASPTPLPYGEVYSALQLGMVDGQVNPAFAIQEMSFYEVTDWLIFPHHAQFFTTVATNDDFYASLSPAHRGLLDEIIREVDDYIFDVQRNLNQTRLAMMQKAKPNLRVIHLSREEQARFREASRPARDYYAQLAGPRGRELLEYIERAIERSRGH